MARILIIDDDEVTRLTTGAMLETEDHEVAYAPNGQVGVSMYARKRYDVVIVDLIMPVKSGVRTIRELCEMDPGARVIAVTGAAPEDLAVAADLGAVHSLIKPIDAERLRATVDNLLQSEPGGSNDRQPWE